MPKVALIQVVYNSRRFMPTVIPAALNQTERDLKFYAVIAGNEDGGGEYLEEHFPEVEIIDPGYNIGFAGGHNLVFSRVDAKYFQLINPDLVVSPDFVQKMLVPFEQSQRVGAVGGKILQYDFDRNIPTSIIDSTGVIIRKSGRALDRGQHEKDTGQYDIQPELMAVSGAAAMYRREALQDIAEQISGEGLQVFDEGFHSYFEDVDLCWRMYNRGWMIRYQAEALAWHGRAVARSPDGYSRLISFVRHRREIPIAIRKLNYRNHFFLFIKNSPGLYLKFLAREFFYNLYALFFETTLLGAIPGMWREFPANWRKRKELLKRRKISRTDAEKLLK